MLWDEDRTFHYIGRLNQKKGNLIRKPGGETYKCNLNKKRKRDRKDGTPIPSKQEGLCRALIPACQVTLFPEGVRGINAYDG